MRMVIILMSIASLSMVFLGCSGFVSRDPNVLLKGTIVDKVSGLPVAGATVGDDNYGSDPPKSTTTDDEGNYSYMTWYEEHTISVRADGYKAEYTTLLTKVFGKEELKTINFQLTPIK